MNEFDIRVISSKWAKEFVRNHHYARGSHNGPSPCFGLFNNGKLIGVCMFATPGSPTVRRSVFGPKYKDHVTELHRLVILDDTPRNTESWFVARCLKMLKQLKPHIWAVISFADPTEGHVGTIYQALNFKYYGRSGPARFYMDQDGRLRHPRQCGVNISLEEASRRGWVPVAREGKHRYVIFLPNDRKHKRELERLCILKFEPYPKKVVTRHDG